MIREIKVPELGEGIENAQITSVLVKAGEPIQKEQSIVEVESDKASLEIPSPAAGRVKEIYVQSGQSIRTGETILSIDASLSQEENLTTEESQKESQEEAKKESQEESQEETKTKVVPEKSKRKYQRKSISTVFSFCRGTN